MPIFRVKSVKIYTGQNFFYRDIYVGFVKNMRYVFNHHCLYIQVFLYWSALKSDLSVRLHSKFHQKSVRIS